MKIKRPRLTKEDRDKIKEAVLKTNSLRDAALLSGRSLSTVWAEKERLGLKKVTGYEQ